MVRGGHKHSFESWKRKKQESTPENFAKVVLPQGLLQKNGSMSLVGGRIDMDVREHVVHRHTDLDAGNLGSPEEVPVLIDLEFFIPTDRLQDVAMGNEAVTNEGTLGNVANAPILAAWNMKHAT